MNVGSVPKKLAFVLLLVLGSLAVMAQERIQWLTWEEAIALSNEEKRKFVVDVYTDWCRFCKKMDTATFQDPNVTEYINENYYAIKFNAEQREDIRLHEKVYKYVRPAGQRGYHQLAAEITFGKLSYPTVVFLDEEMQVIQPIAGYKEADFLELVMKYFAEDHHKTTAWKQFYTSQRK